MQNLINILKEYKKNFPIEKKFDWKIPEKSPCHVPIALKDNYEKNIYLKEHMKDILENDLTLESHYWIIQKWGGISSFKYNEINSVKIQKFIEELRKKKLTKSSFNVISSFSKIASFMEYESYVIYDSRVIYSLNWLLLKHTNIKELFPQPSGRNKELAKYDLNTIISLLDKNYSYKTHENAYFEYCELIKKLSSEIYEPDKPYKLEMLLFMIAPEIIVNDVKSTIKIELRS